MAKAGEVVVWGDSASLSGAPVTDDFHIIAPAGHSQSLAIQVNGKLKLWGIGSVPALAGNLLSDSFVDAAITPNLLIAIRADNNKIEIAGDFNNGGALSPADDPTAPKNMTVSAVTAGGPHAVVIGFTDRLLYQWGPRTAPHPAGKFTHVRARHAYTIGLDENGNLYGWGGVEFPFAPSTIPSYLQGWESDPNFMRDIFGPPKTDVAWRRDSAGHLFVPGPFVDLAAGVREDGGTSFPHILALRPNGAVVGWGGNKYHQAEAPHAVQFTEIGAGKRFSVGIDTKGGIHHWGEGKLAGLGQVWPSVPVPPNPSPTLGPALRHFPLLNVPTPGPFRSIGAAVGHAAAVRGRKVLDQRVKQTIKNIGLRG